jgi:hypothetical protein
MLVFATTAFTMSSLITPPSRIRGPMLEANSPGCQDVPPHLHFLF